MPADLQREFSFIEVAQDLAAGQRGLSEQSVSFTLLANRRFGFAELEKKLPVSLVMFFGANEHLPIAGDNSAAARVRLHRLHEG